MKEDVPFSMELCEGILARLKGGEALTDICTGSAMPTRAAFYQWLDIHPELHIKYKRACRIRARVYRDQIEQWSNPENIDTVLIDDNGRQSTHSANVAAHQLGCQWRKWLASLHAPDEFSDDQPIKFDFNTDAKPEEQINQVIKQLADGTVTLKQAQALCDMLYKRIDLLELPKLIEIVKRHEAMLAGDNRTMAKFGSQEGALEAIPSDKDGQ